MAEGDLLQAEADALIVMEKYRVNDRVWEYPAPSGALSIPLISHDGHEHFLLDRRRGRLNVRKGSYQTRARHVIVLVRLCFGGAPHRNPDGEQIPVPHLHRYREGYGDKGALPLPRAQFPTITDLWQMLGDFMRYCHIIEPPHIDRGLFP
jgi:uncharacterized protein DUF6978